MTRVKA